MCYSVTNDLFVVYLGATGSPDGPMGVPGPHFAA